MTAGKVSLPDALAGLGLAPGPERLTPLARWITPLARPRRFDTVFYLAPLPPGQTPSPDQTEVSSGEWLGPARALAANAAGRAPLAPPQVKLMGMLAEAGSAEDLWSRAAGASLAPVLPVLHLDDQGGRTILLPSDPDYAAGRPQAQARPCPAGQSSRLVHVSGVWLPFIA